MEYGHFQQVILPPHEAVVVGVAEARKRAEHDHAPHPFGIRCRIEQRDGPSLRVPIKHRSITMQSVDEAADVIHQLLRGRHAIDSVRQALAPLVVLDDAKSSAETLDPAAVGFEFREGLQMRNHAWDDYQVGGVVLATGSIRDLQLAAGSVAEATIDHRPLPCIRIRCSSAFQNLPRPVAGQSAGGQDRQ